MPSTAAKLDGLDLTAAEKEAFDLVLARAAGADVEGFGVVFGVETSRGPVQDVWLDKIAAATGADLSQLPRVCTDMRP